ncbi:fatty acid metabolism transcriptional regulator FadR, partial [Enterobacter hormaechei]|nr:fatty acid metabolism transcriptional regulator FadR [Enterobacter hormaechei]
MKRRSLFSVSAALSASARLWYDECNLLKLCNGNLTMVIKAQSPA